MGDLRTLLAGEPAEARKELLKHVSEIRMIPQSEDRKPHYVAEGSWHLLGNEKDASSFENTVPMQIRVVAGEGLGHCLTSIIRIPLR